MVKKSGKVEFLYIVTLGELILIFVAVLATIVVIVTEINLFAGVHVKLSSLDTLRVKVEESQKREITFLRQDLADIKAELKQVNVALTSAESKLVQHMKNTDGVLKLKPANGRP